MARLSSSPQNIPEVSHASTRGRQLLGVRKIATCSCVVSTSLRSICQTAVRGTYKASERFAEESAASVGSFYFYVRLLVQKVLD